MIDSNIYSQRVRRERERGGKKGGGGGRERKACIRLMKTVSLL